MAYLDDTDIDLRFHHNKLEKIRANNTQRQQKKGTNKKINFKRAEINKAEKRKK